MKNKPKSSAVSGLSKKRTLHWIVYLALFLLTFGILDYGYSLTRGTIIEHLVIDTFTVRPAAGLINALLPGASVSANGQTLGSSTAQINIARGCEGTGGMFLLIAAVVPFPARWIAKLAGIVGGVLLMYTLNQVRLLILVVALRWHQNWFVALHSLVAPTVIVIVGCLFFLVWASAVASPDALS